MFLLGGEGSSKPNEKVAESGKGKEDSKDSDTDNAVDTNFDGGVIEQLTEADARKRKVSEDEESPPTDEFSKNDDQTNENDSHINESDEHSNENDENENDDQSKTNEFFESIPIFLIFL